MYVCIFMHACIDIYEIHNPQGMSGVGLDHHSGIDRGTHKYSVAGIFQNHVFKTNSPPPETHWPHPGV